MECKVLLIESDPAYMELFRNVGARFGCLVDVCREGSPEEIAMNNYKCHFVDLDGDFEKGLSAIQLIIDVKSNPCVIAMTSSAERVRESEIRSQGITFLLEKPFKSDIIHELFEIQQKRLAV